jgi:hypothetical protein|tara:strand:- start:176 stop:772 length:597 start_codon:yes stop_codon:yes gene_type:complete
MSRIINYNFFHWGPFLYKTAITKEELNLIKNLCHKKKNKDFRKRLAGILRHEYEVDRKKLFSIIAPYFESYLKAFSENYHGKPLGNKIELMSSWVNYMTKFESNPLHTHDRDLSFIIFTQVQKDLLEEHSKNIGNTKPGCINFIYSLEDRKELINQHTFFPEVGDLFIFPACLYHYVNSFQCEGERISVSGNLEVTDG